MEWRCKLDKFCFECDHMVLIHRNTSGSIMSKIRCLLKPFKFLTLFVRGFEISCGPEGLSSVCLSRIIPQSRHTYVRCCFVCVFLSLLCRLHLGFQESRRLVFFFWLKIPSQPWLCEKYFSPRLPRINWKILILNGWTLAKKCSDVNAKLLFYELLNLGRKYGEIQGYSLGLFYCLNT